MKISRSMSILFILWGLNLEFEIIWPPVGPYQVQEPVWVVEGAVVTKQLLTSLNILRSNAVLGSRFNIWIFTVIPELYISSLAS